VRPVEKKLKKYLQVDLKEFMKAGKQLTAAK
jgi:hypothetical protein